MFLSEAIRSWLRSSDWATRQEALFRELWTRNAGWVAVQDIGTRVDLKPVRTSACVSVCLCVSVCAIRTLTRGVRFSIETQVHIPCGGHISTGRGGIVVEVDDSQREIPGSDRFAASLTQFSLSVFPFHQLHSNETWLYATADTCVHYYHPRSSCSVA